MRAAPRAPLHPALRAFPGVVLEITPEGRVVDSNGRLDARLGRELVGGPLDEVLDGTSGLKLSRMLARGPETGAQPGLWELMVRDGGDGYEPRTFYASWEDAAGEPRVWLVECPRDPRLGQLYDELAAVNSEQASTQRQLAKEKARLGRALDELERELHENAKLSQTLQQQNEEMEAQNEELLAMTEELHAGQEQLMQLNHQLERRTRELQLAVSARNRFYASMSHELRTPINAVLGYNDLLLASIYGPLNEQQELAIERSQRAARHLRELVDDVLDLSRLEGGRLDVVATEVDVSALVDELLDTLRPMASSMGSELRLVRPQAGDLRVRTDARRVRQILLNLVGNAIKFGRGAPVWATGGPLPGGGVWIEVSDGGEGIRSEDMGRIFDEFVQLGPDGGPASAGEAGTGLGLPISRRLATLLGGTLSVASAPGVGSTFRLELPHTPPAP